MKGKTKVLMWVLLILVVVILVAVFWRDLTLVFSRVGVTIAFVVGAFAIGWLLGFARGRYKR